MLRFEGQRHEDNKKIKALHKMVNNGVKEYDLILLGL